MIKRKMVLKPYTPSQLARLYGISVSTLNRRLRPYRDELGPKQGQFYTTQQLEFITGKMGGFHVELSTK
jgi:hypothetical protein